MVPSSSETATPILTLTSTSKPSQRTVPLHRVEQLVRELERGSFVGDVGGDHDELVTPETRDEICSPQPCSKTARDLRQHLVAHTVTDVVVDRREVVDVAEHQRRSSDRPGLFEHGVEAGVQCGSVRQRREPVVGRHEPQFTFDDVSGSAAPEERFQSELIGERPDFDPRLITDEPDASETNGAITEFGAQPYPHRGISSKQVRERRIIEAGSEAVHRPEQRHGVVSEFARHRLAHVDHPVVAHSEVGNRFPESHHSEVAFGRKARRPAHVPSGRRVRVRRDCGTDAACHARGPSARSSGSLSV